MYNYYGLSEGASAGSSVISFAIGILMLISYVFIFSKADEAPWAPFLPIYNAYCLTRLTLGNGWYFLVLLIPIANLFFLALVTFRLAIVFEKSIPFAIFAIFFPYIAIPIIAFGNCKYRYIS